MAKPTMTYRITPEMARQLKAQGFFDSGTQSIRIFANERKPKHRFWDGYVPPDDRASE